MYGLLRVFIFFIFILFFFILSYFIVIIISGKKGQILDLYINYNSRLKKVKCCQNTSESKHYNFIFCNEPFGWIATDGFWLHDCIKWFFCFLIKNGSNIILHKVQSRFSKLSISIYWVFWQTLFHLYMYTSTYTSCDLSRTTHK